MMEEICSFELLATNLQDYMLVTMEHHKSKCRHSLFLSFSFLGVSSFHIILTLFL